MTTHRLVNKEIEFLNRLLHRLPLVREMDAEQIHAAIAEAAYAKAEMRGFAPGDELSDWLAAECEICNQRNRTAAETI